MLVSPVKIDIYYFILPAQNFSVIEFVSQSIDIFSQKRGVRILENRVKSMYFCSRFRKG
ncbi:MAG: hypothetical protein PWQ17_2585 [Anaerophaga sp.]|nr:hypothetical protein [Anaerophaga sp.]MDK2843078.1 hypothetical protein [Anaerophaga sp.]